MSDCVKILFLKEDLLTLSETGDVSSGIDPEVRLSERLRDSAPDAIALDLTQLSANAEGCAVIAAIRRHSELPLIVVSAQAEAFESYVAHGASECLKAPVDIGVFGQTAQQLVGMARASATSVKPTPTTNETGRQTNEYVELGASLRLNMRRSSVSGRGRREVSLTTAELRLLSELVGKPKTVLSRAELGVAIYGRHQPVSERAVDVIVSRLRNKLGAATGEEARYLIRTEFRSGYSWTAEVEPSGRIAVARNVDSRSSQRSAVHIDTDRLNTQRAG